MMESVEDNEKDSKTKRKNYRGTRRQQRYRAKQKLWQLCELASAQDTRPVETEENVLNNNWNVSLSLSCEDTERKSRTNKRKRELLPTPTIAIPNNVIESFSQLSIIPQPVPVQEQKRTRRSFNKHRNRKRKKESSLPDYLNVPHRIFKKMFLSASQSLHCSVPYSTISQWLDNRINMRHIREYARLLDKMLYLQLQQALWKEYYTIGSLPDGVWASEVQDKIKRQETANHSISIDPLSFVTRYQTQIEEQLHTTENELNRHLNRITYVIGQPSQVQPIDLSVMLKAFIRRGQHKLNAEFECKKRLLHFDYQDHRLTKAFFDLKPTRKQIQSAKKIWSATMKQQIAEEQITILKHRIFAKILPKTFDSIDRSLSYVNRSLQNDNIDKDIRVTLANRHDKVLGQFKLDIMSIDISIAEATARGRTHIVEQEKEKLISSRHAENEDETTMHNIINAIQARRESIIKRAQYITGCKVSFFDEAPAMLTN